MRKQNIVWLKLEEKKEFNSYFISETWGSQELIEKGPNTKGIVVNTSMNV